MTFQKPVFTALLIMALFVLKSYGQENPDRFFIQSNRFFDKYVFEGRVDYAAIRSNPQSLNKLTGLLTTTDLKSARADAKKAFWINAYNILVIREVMDSFPVTGVNEIPGFFEKQIFNVQGETLSLKDIEEKKLKEVYKDPRLDFLLCKGLRGGPKLLSESITPEMISTQLIEQMTSIINDTAFVKTDHDGFWKMADFFSVHQDELRRMYGSMQDFVNKFRKMPVGPDYLLEFFKTDQALNIDDRYAVGAGNKADPAKALASGSRPAYASEADDGRLPELIMLPRRKVEIRLNNNFVYYRETYSMELRRSTLKYSYASNLASLQLFYGIGRKVTVGISANAQTVSLAGTFASPTDIYGLKIDTNSAYYLRSVTPIIRLNIFEGYFYVRMQNSFNIPVTRIDPLKFDGLRLSEENPFLLTTQLYISRYLSDYVKMGLEVDFGFKFNNSFTAFTITPRAILNTIFSLPLNHSIRIYGLLESAPGPNTSVLFKSYYFKEGTGIAIRLGKSEVALYYSYVFLGKKVNAVNAFVVNIRAGL